MTRFPTALLLCLGLAACALSTGVATIDYEPQDGVVPDERAAAIGLQVSVRDAREVPRDWVGLKMSGWGTKEAPIYPDRDVLEILRDALTMELTNRGYPLRSGGARVDIALTWFNSKFRYGIPAADALAEVSFDATVFGETEDPFYSEQVTGLGENPNVLIMASDSAEVALERALATAVSQLMADAAFIDALKAAAGSVDAPGA